MFDGFAVDGVCLKRVVGSFKMPIEPPPTSRQAQSPLCRNAGLNSAADRARFQPVAKAFRLVRRRPEPWVPAKLKGPSGPSLNVDIFGSPGRIRTSDQPVNSRLLYH